MERGPRMAGIEKRGIEHPLNPKAKSGGSSMRIRTLCFVFACCFGFVKTPLAAVETPGVEKVEIQPNRAIHVNGRLFFPIMAWLQDPKNFPAIRDCGMNTVAGCWPKSGGVRDVKEYLDLVQKAGLYGVMPFDGQLKGHPALLGYIHDDEPDLPRLVSDAVIEPAENLRINPRTPLWKLVDGDVFSWSVLDPLEGASVTVKLNKPATVESLAVWLTISEGLAVASEIVFEADGKKVLTAKVAAERGRQKFDLPAPTTLTELTLRISSVKSGYHEWGSLSEVEGFDRQGRNVLLSAPRTLPRLSPEDVLRQYHVIKSLAPSRPVFMTLTGYFHPFFNKYNEEQRKMYPQYIQAADIIGFDIYPIYGWNKPEWIHLVHEGTELLVEMARGKPVYAWIETSKGGRWTGELSRQNDVTPAHIRAEVWMAICRGATAIGYFTHVWKPSYSQFGVPPTNREAMRRINAQLTRLAPAILGEDPAQAVSIRGDEAVKLDALAKRFGENLYIFALNYDGSLRSTRATVTVGDLSAGTSVTVIDEDRTIASENGYFVDTFEPLDVHIYRIRGSDAGLSEATARGGGSRSPVSATDVRSSSIHCSAPCPM